MRILWATALLAAAAAGARADVVHLKNGGKVEGVVRDLGDAIEVQSSAGTIKIPRAQVVEIEKKEYVPPARPKGDELPPAPELGERFRDPFLGIEIALPYGWLANPPSRGSVFTFYGPPRVKYRAKLDVLSKSSPMTTAEFLALRRKEFADTFPGAELRDDEGFTAGGLTFSGFSGELASEGLSLHTLQAAAAQGEQHFVLSLVCEAADREAARAEAAKAFASFRFVEPVTRDRAVVDRFKDAMARATEAYKKGDTEAAISGYKAASEILPAHPMPWQNLGLIYASRNRMDEAVAVYRKVTELLPDSASAHANLATVYRTMGKYEDARTTYEKLLTIDPRHAEAYVNLSAIYQMKGDAGTAIRCARTAIAISPDNAPAHFNLAQLLNMQGRSDEALAEYKRVLVIDPGHKLAQQEIERMGK